MGNCLRQAVILPDSTNIEDSARRDSRRRGRLSSQRPRSSLPTRASRHGLQRRRCSRSHPARRVGRAPSQSERLQRRIVSRYPERAAASGDLSHDTHHLRGLDHPGLRLRKDSRPLCSIRNRLIFIFFRPIPCASYQWTSATLVFPLASLTCARPLSFRQRPEPNFRRSRASKAMGRPASSRRHFPVTP